MTSVDHCCLFRFILALSRGLWHPIVLLTTACYNVKCWTKNGKGVFHCFFDCNTLPNSLLASLVWLTFIFTTVSMKIVIRLLSSFPAIRTITLSPSLFPHVLLYSLVPSLAMSDHKRTFICNISGLSVGVPQTTDEEVSSA